MMMPIKRREALSKYFLDLSKVILAMGVLTPLFGPPILNGMEIVLALLIGILVAIIGYHFQPKE